MNEGQDVIIGNLAADMRSTNIQAEEGKKSTVDIYPLNSELRQKARLNKEQRTPAEAEKLFNIKVKELYNSLMNGEDFTLQKAEELYILFRQIMKDDVWGVNSTIRVPIDINLLFVITDYKNLFQNLEELQIYLNRFKTNCDRAEKLKKENQLQRVRNGAIHFHHLTRSQLLNLINENNLTDVERYLVQSLLGFPMEAISSEDLSRLEERSLHYYDERVN